jgi:Holliday junction DNA helicase RuvA
VMALGARGKRTAAASGPVPTAEKASAAPVALPSGAMATADALSALVNLGYDRMQAARAVAEAGDEAGGEAGGEAGDEAGASSGALIKAALKTLGRNL